VTENRNLNRNHKPYSRSPVSIEMHGPGTLVYLGLGTYVYLPAILP